MFVVLCPWHKIPSLIQRINLFRNLSERSDLTTDAGPLTTNTEHLCSEFSRQTSGGKDMMGIKSVFNAVHYLPFRSVEAEDIIMLLELDGCLFHYHMAAQLIGKVA